MRDYLAALQGPGLASVFNDGREVIGRAGRLWAAALLGAVVVTGFALRFPDAYTRLHALTQADNLGIEYLRRGSAASRMACWWMGN